MRKTFILSAFMLFFVLCNVASAANYFIRPDARIRTKTFSDNITRTEIWFAIGDSDNYNHMPIESVVESVTIGNHYYAYQQFSDPPLYDLNENISDMPEDVVRIQQYYITEFRGRDINKNGTIEQDLGELEKIHNSDWAYSILTSSFPITGGDYVLSVNCTNGQKISRVISGVSAAMTLQLPTNINAGFNDDGRFNVSWNLPDEYLTNYQQATIQIRVDRFERDGSQKFWRTSAQNLPLFINGKKFENYTFLKWESDLLRTYSKYFPFVKVNVRIELKNSRAISDWIGFRIDGYTVTPQIIPVPSYLTEEEVDALVAETCPGKSENFGRPESPGQSNPPEWN